MPRVTNRIVSAPLAVALILGGLSLSGCATKKYVDEQVGALSSRVDAVDAKATDAIRRADAANAAAQGAGSAAQAGATDATTANQRLDQLTPRVDALEQRAMKRRPRN